MAEMDDLLPTLFSKTFFIVSAQLLITWLTTHAVFVFFERIDPKLSDTNQSDSKIVEDVEQRWRWIFTDSTQNLILVVWFATFLILLFWGEYQELPISFSVFSAWSIITGIMLEYVLITFDQGLGRRVIALTAAIILLCAVIGIYSKIDLGFLQPFLFIALNGLVLFSILRLFGAMKSVRQGAVSSFGIGLFTLYLLFDFNSVAKRQAAGQNSWIDAMRMAIKIYLDAINLLLHLLSKHHHS
ncbi:MAG: hypothetical protein EPO08_15960 [Rhodospirillaceae bacterium]|nr:MAG: hypothetical protein EPO08_15960 [Rhodospirillaceae bacterium]